jgi:GNAT superfamily N-acetyltransferase
MNVQPSTVAEIKAAPHFDVLAAEYAAESLIPGMPPPVAQWEAYRQLESAGMLHAFSAIIPQDNGDRRLVGFISVLASVLPRYGVPIAISESWFVAKAYRKTGAGLKLLRIAEEKARELGSPVLLVSAPCEGDLFQVLPRRGYAETNRIFFKKVSDA